MSVSSPCLAVLALFVASVALAEPKTGPNTGRMPIYTKPHELENSLQRVARKFFTVRLGEMLQIRCVYSQPEYQSRADLNRYEVKGRDGRLLGSFVRLRVYVSDDSTVDLAMTIEGGKILAIEPMRPVKIRGKTYLGLPALLSGLGNQEPRDYGQGLSRFFLALLELERASAGESSPPISEPVARMLRDALKMTRPAPMAGSPMPAFDLEAIDGTRLTPARLTGRRSLLVFGLVEMGITPQVMNWVADYAASHPGRFDVAQVLCDTPVELSQFRLRGGRLTGLVAADVDRRVSDAFNAVILPALYVYDREKRLVTVLEPPIASYEDLAARLDAIE